MGVYCPPSARTIGLTKGMRWLAADCRKSRDALGGHGCRLNHQRRRGKLDDADLLGGAVKQPCQGVEPSLCGGRISQQPDRALLRQKLSIAQAADGPRDRQCPAHSVVVLTAKFNIIQDDDVAVPPRPLLPGRIEGRLVQEVCRFQEIEHREIARLSEPEGVFGADGGTQGALAGLRRTGDQQVTPGSAKRDEIGNRVGGTIKLIFGRCLKKGNKTDPSNTSFAAYYTV